MVAKLFRWFSGWDIFEGKCASWHRVRNAMSNPETVAQPRLRVRRLTNMPPRLKPIAAPSTAAVNIVLGVEPLVLRDKRTHVYAIATVQKVSRRYMNVPLGEIVSRPPSRIASNYYRWKHSNFESLQAWCSD